MKLIENIIGATDYIGQMGPNITFVINCFVLLYLSEHIYLIVFLGGFWLNLIINNELKSIIREPRPSNPVPYIDSAFTGAHIYGMPSGHAQTCFYNFAFLFLTFVLVKRNLWWYNTVLITSFAVCIITLYQRWKYRRHTIQQLAVGSLLGSFVGYTTYLICYYKKV